VSTGKPFDYWLTDMDGVLVHEDVPIPGAQEFVDALKGSGRPFLVLTNNSIFTPRDLRSRLLGSGIDVPEHAIWTSALATAQFLADQRPDGSAYVVGEAGQQGKLPATGSVAALISTATGRQPYFIGKPNPLMMRSALNRLGAHSETAVMIGDRMDTDIISGLEAGMRTIHVGTGSTRPEEVKEFPYRPTWTVASVADLVDLAGRTDVVDTDFRP
jgi:NagD protein